MTDYYVGKGGNDANDGLSWANRKLTLNGAEDIPVVPGDIVWIGAGAYRETLIMDVDGTDTFPNRVFYVGDTMGHRTDGIGGIVRVTGSDDDLVATRSTCVTGGKAFRTFQNIQFDLATDRVVDGEDCPKILIYACSVNDGDNIGIYLPSGSGDEGYVDSCIVRGNKIHGIYSESLAISAAAHEIHNSYIEGSQNGIYLHRITDCVLTFLTVLHHDIGIYCPFELLGAENTIRYCLIGHNGIGISAAEETDFDEDYNNLWHNDTPRENVSTGANSVAEAFLFANPMLTPQLKVPSPQPGELSEWSSSIRKETPDLMQGADLYSTLRPYGLDGKISWGSTQYHPVVQSSIQTFGASPASLKLEDWGVAQFAVPVLPVSTTVTVQVYREADYTGDPPILRIRQGIDTIHGTDPDGGAAEVWNELSVTFTPDALTGFIVVELQSRNSADAGDYAVYFDDLTVI